MLCGFIAEKSTFLKNGEEITGHHSWSCCLLQPPAWPFRTVVSSSWPLQVGWGSSGRAGGDGSGMGCPTIRICFGVSHPKQPDLCCPLEMCGRFISTNILRTECI